MVYLFDSSLTSNHRQQSLELVFSWLFIAEVNQKKNIDKNSLRVSLLIEYFQLTASKIVTIYCEKGKTGKMDKKNSLELKIKTFQ